MEEGAKIATSRLQPRIEAKEKELELITGILEENIAANLIKDEELNELRPQVKILKRVNIIWKILSFIGLGGSGSGWAAYALKPSVKLQ